MGSAFVMAQTAAVRLCAAPEHAAAQVLVAVALHGVLIWCSATSRVFLGMVTLPAHPGILEGAY